MNEDFTRLQQLLRLKRHEQPPPGFYDDVLAEVRRRRALPATFSERAAAGLRQIAEAVNRRAVIAWGAGAYAAVMLLLWLWPKPDLTGNTILVAVPATQAGPGSNAQRQTIPVSSGADEAPPRLIAPPGLPRVPGNPRDRDRDTILGPREDHPGDGNAPAESPDSGPAAEQKPDQKPDQHVRRPLGPKQG